MTALVLAEHDNVALKAATLNAISAALKIDQDVHVLVVGAGCKAVADAAAKVKGVSKVLLIDDARYKAPLAEVLAPVIVALALLA